MSTDQRRLAAIVVADIVGFSSKAQRDEASALDVLRLFSEMAEPIFERHGARLVKNLGDGYLVELPSALQSVLSAVQLQAQIAESNARVESESCRFSVRIGIHLGDVESVGGDIFGDGVNLASRIQGMAEPGGICVSEDVYRQVRGHGDLQFTPLGGPPLKNIHRAIELFKVVLEPGPSVGAQRALETLIKIAVLPFANFSSDPENAHFCDGLADEIISALCKIGKLRVVSRTSSFALKGIDRSIREIGELLGVQVVVEGSVRKFGDRIRVIVQVIDVESDLHLWTEQYERDLQDIFAIQEELTHAIVSALEVAVTPEERQALVLSGTDDVYAYELYLQGLQQYWRFSIPGLRAARSLFREAIALDPNFARAFFGLAQCAAYHFFFWGEHTMLEDAQWAAERVHALAPEAAETAVARGLAHLLAGENAEAQALFEEAVVRDPQCYDAWYALARCLFSRGSFSEAIDAYERAAAVRIDDYQSLGLAMVACRSMGDEVRRKSIAERLLPKLVRHRRLHPDDPRAGYFEASVYATLGEKERAVERLEHTISLGPTDPSIMYNAACVYCLLGMHEEAIRYLACTAESGFADPDWLERDMDLRDLREDPRFQTVLRQTGINRRKALRNRESGQS